MLDRISGLGGEIRNDLLKFGIVIRWIDPDPCRLLGWETLFCTLMTRDQKDSALNEMLLKFGMCCCGFP
jgi:hypothetical protein